MQILLWLVPAAVATCAAMAVAAYAGRERVTSDKREQAAQERFARAITKHHPGLRQTRTPATRDRSTGIAVRRPGPRPDQRERRSA